MYTPVERLPSSIYILAPKRAVWLCHMLPKDFQNHLMILKISKMTALTESPKPQKNV